jgi:anti-sigma regulatory factor (Ser/Thr protein kinase)
MNDSLVREFTFDDLRALRHETERFAAGHGLTDLALYRFVVAVNELTTNAVRHGGGAGLLELRLVGAVLQCRVTDNGPECRPFDMTTPRRSHGTSTDEDYGWLDRTPQASTSTANRPEPASP